MLSRDELVAAVVDALDDLVPNTDGVLWDYTHPDTGEKEPVTLTHAANAAINVMLAKLEKHDVETIGILLPIR